MKKRILALMCAVVLGGSLAACGSSGGTDAKSTASSGSKAESSAASSSASGEEKTGGFKVAYIARNSPIPLRQSW